jgi:hypothetical protein
MELEVFHWGVNRSGELAPAMGASVPVSDHFPEFADSIKHER